MFFAVCREGGVEGHCRYLKAKISKEQLFDFSSFSSEFITELCSFSARLQLL